MCWHLVEENLVTGFSGREKAIVYVKTSMYSQTVVYVIYVKKRKQPSVKERKEEEEKEKEKENTFLVVSNKENDKHENMLCQVCLWPCMSI